MHRIDNRTSPTELNVFTELVLPLLELLSPATTVHLEPSDLAHALSALQMAYDYMTFQVELASKNNCWGLA